MSDIRKFAGLKQDDIDSLLDQKDSKSTKSTVDKAVRMFREYLVSCQEDDVFENLSDEDLNSKLRVFYANVRKKSGEHFKQSSLHSIKYGLSKYLKEKCSKDINKDAAFESSRAVYHAVIVDNRKKGFADVDHKPPITPEDLHKLQSADALDVNTPAGLQARVWFCIMYFICRRGRENMREMTKDTFTVGKSANGRLFICQKVGELDKNHRESDFDATTGEGRIYNCPGSLNCPVICYQKYIQKLHPQCTALWQRPLEKFDKTDDTWYYNAPLGKNTLCKMMPTISQLAQLSKIYTNHSIRATCITVLDENRVEARHIMRISGHKNESSIRSYASRLNEQKKEEISDTLSSALAVSNILTPVAQPRTSVITPADGETVAFPDHDEDLFHTLDLAQLIETDNGILSVPAAFPATTRSDLGNFVLESSFDLGVLEQDNTSVSVPPALPHPSLSQQGTRADLELVSSQDRCVNSSNNRNALQFYNCQVSINYNYHDKQ